MRLWIAFILLLVMTGFGCSRTMGEREPRRSAEVSAWPKDWSAHLGKTVTVEGTALDAKVGAVLAGDGPDIWIDGLDSWPAGLYFGGNKGKRVRVTGTVIERSDLPVFVPEEGEPPKTGMPVEPGTDLQKAAKRFLLKDVKWTVVE